MSISDAHFMELDLDLIKLEIWLGCDVKKNLENVLAIALLNEICRSSYHIRMSRTRDIRPTRIVGIFRADYFRKKLTLA